MELPQLLEKSTGSELEIRYKPDLQEFISVLRSRNDWTPETTVNVLLENNVIYTLKYSGSNVVSREYTKKSRIGHVYYMGMKVNVASEEKVEKPSSGTLSHVRFKYRLSAQDGDFRYDVTLVGTGKFSGVDKISPVAGEVFTPYHNVEKFIEHCQTLFTTGRYGFEIEAEYTGTGVPAVGVINTTIDKLYSMMGSNPAEKYLKYITAIVYGNPTQHSIGRKPITMGRKEWTQDVMTNLSQYFCSLKADGLRSFVYMAGDVAVYIDTEVNNIRDKKINKHSPPRVGGCSDVFGGGIRRQDIYKPADLSIFEAERVGDKLYIYDVLYISGENVTDKNYSARVEHIDTAVSMCAPMGSKKPQLNITSPEMITDICDTKVDFPTDGLIFTRDGDNYAQTIKYKWKPAEQNTVDFLVLGVPDDMKIEEFARGDNILCVGINNNQKDRAMITFLPEFDKILQHNGVVVVENSGYFPIHFTTRKYPQQYIYTPGGREPATPYIGEFTVHFSDNVAPVYTFYRARPDKVGEYGNNYSVAQQIVTGAVNPLTIEEMTSTTHYFKQHNSTLYLATRRFNSHVKRELIKQYVSGVVIDLASGKGQDINKYVSAGVKKLIMVDRDELAIQELQSRARTAGVDIDYVVADILEVDLQKKLGGRVANSVVCNFAIHYFLKTEQTFEKFISVVLSVLKNDGHFIFTGFNGAGVLEKTRDAPWIAYQDTVLKYKIERKFTTDVLLTSGQEIQTLLPFSGGELYSEYLINFDWIIEKLSGHGLKLVTCEGFSKMFNTYRGPQLSDIDKEFVSLYNWAVFKLHV